MTRFIADGIEVPAIPKLYLWPDGGWRPEPPQEESEVVLPEGVKRYSFEEYQKLNDNWPTPLEEPEDQPRCPLCGGVGRLRYVMFGQGIPGQQFTTPGLRECTNDDCPSNKPEAVDPQPEKTLRERLLAENGGQLDYDEADDALRIFREHFDSKLTDNATRLGLTPQMVDALRQELFGS